MSSEALSKFMSASRSSWPAQRSSRVGTTQGYFRRGHWSWRTLCLSLPRRQPSDGTSAHETLSMAAAAGALGFDKFPVLGR